MITAIISILLLFGAHSKSYEKQANTIAQYGDVDTITTSAGIELNKHTNAWLKGRFQKFTPWKEGKGANHMFWNWEIVLSDNSRYPVVPVNSDMSFRDFEDKDVLVYGKVFHGIIIGDSNPDHQSMTGYRIDAHNVIILAETRPHPGTLDTCRTWNEIESHYNMYAYVQGKIIEYVPPRDHSKIGDYKIWDWELVTADNYSIPLTAKNSALDINSFMGKNVTVKAYILNGIIFGEENTANIRGTRIDAEEISINEPVDPASKIMLKLEDFNDEGLRERPKGEFSSTSYEFCIPATDEAVAEVQAIDPTAGILKTSKGRSGCSDKEWLVISSTRQANFKQVILKLAGLSYVRKITETFWE
jgi:hypothetical protein